MAPKTWSFLALFLITLNVLLIAHVSGDLDCPFPKPPIPKPPTPAKPKPAGCPRDALKLGVCSNVLDGKANFSMGVPNTPCCSFFHGLVDFDAAVCLCTALRANICGFNIDIPISFTFLLNFCSLQAPANFNCLPH